mgnify:FL=1
MERELSSSSSGLLSHPEKALEDHLQSVAALAAMSLEDNPSILIDRDLLKKVVEIITLCHDIGKSSGYFQAYISAPPEKMKSLKNRKSTHSLLGAVAAYFLVEDLLERKGHLSGLNELLPFASFLACRKHHGNLADINSEVIINCDDESLLKDQLSSMDKKKFDILLNKIGNPFTYDWLSQKLENLTDKSFDIEEKTKGFLRNKGLSAYFLVHLVYSLLLDSDKNEVAVTVNRLKTITESRNHHYITPDIITGYKNALPKNENEINILREKAFQEIMQNDIDTNQKIYSINLPTGLGKTITSFSFALKLREIIKKEKGYSPRIIYSLPFLSIIDQNSAILEDILRKAKITPSSNLLLKHHHLSNINYRISTNNQVEEEFEYNASKILTESWNSEIIVTTFVQLFHTLISNRNRSIMKFHRISGSIVILDEVQSIPHKYWLLMHEIIDFMAAKFNTYFVFVTATEPLIFGRNEVKALVDRENYFRKLNRVKLKPEIARSLTVEEFANLSIPEVFNSNKKFLFIFNTISSAKEFYNRLKEHGIGKDEMAFLSTHIIPKERLGRINQIKNGGKKIVVSTQLVEAGVDIDFDIVYRDFAPLDSINQAAGRCNRNGLTSGGEIRVIRLVDEKTGRDYTSHIYNKNSILLDITKKILSGREEIHEADFLDLIENYYSLVSGAKADHKSREVLEAFYRLNYDGDKGISFFSLIDEDYQKVDIFIQIDESAVSLWERFLTISTLSDFNAKRNEYDKIKNVLHEYTVSVPMREDLNLPAIQESMPFVSFTQLDEYYDAETGYKLKGGIAIW